MRYASRASNGPDHLGLCAPAELSYRLPFKAASKFRDLFNTFESQKEKLNIADYGVSVTTLEEVFLLVASGEREDDSAGMRPQAPQNLADDAEDPNSLQLKDTAGIVVETGQNGGGSH